MEPPGLAASVRLLLSAETPTWNGNEFLLASGARPVIRTLTPLRFAASGDSLDVEIVLHGGGALSDWVTSASVGDQVALSGPGRGYEIAPSAALYVLAGDETAVPAMGQLADELQRLAVPFTAHVELSPGSGGALGPVGAQSHSRSDDEPPGEALVRAVVGAEIPDGARVWAAGEAAAVQRIRRHLFEERGLTRSQATVRGYWKHGRAGDADDA